MRLDKWLANSGIGTRNEVKKIVKAARVSVNGHVATDPGQHVTPGEDTVLFDGEEISYEPFVYFMMYKPLGVLSATEDKYDPVVTGLLTPEDSRFSVFPVGRLDKDAEGLLLLTNDGQLSHQLLSPKKHVPKRYLVHVEGVLTHADVQAIKAGVVLEDGYAAMPGQLTIKTSDHTSTAEITIYEGKFHQVKRMFEALGKHVVFLKRLQMGGLLLDEMLEQGEYRPLSPEERMALTHVTL